MVGLVTKITSAYSRVGRGNLVSRHSVPHLPADGNFAALQVEWQKLTPGLLPWYYSEVIKILINIPSTEDRTHNGRVTVTPLCPCATTASQKYRWVKNNKYSVCLFNS